jgi:hypothetical protein
MERMIIDMDEVLRDLFEIKKPAIIDRRPISTNKR